MKFREATPEDIRYISEHSISRDVQKFCPPVIDFCFVLEDDDGFPLGIGCFRLINLTTAWCWMSLTAQARRNIIIGFRTIKEWMPIFVKQHNIKRLQAYVEADFPEAIRTAEHLGFRRESTMKNFIGDKDAYMYVRFF